MSREVPFRSNLWVVWVYDDEDDTPYAGGAYEDRDVALMMARSFTDDDVTVACVTQMWAMQAVGGPILGSFGWILGQIGRFVARLRGESEESGLSAEEIHQLDQMREKLKERQG